MRSAVTTWIRVLAGQLWAATVQHRMQMALETRPSCERAIVARKHPQFHLRSFVMMSFVSSLVSFLR